MAGEDWTLAARTYAAIASKISNPIAQRTLEYHSELWAPSAGDDSSKIRFLDVAAGPGFFSKSLAEKLSKEGYSYTILCTDFAEGMLDVARKDLVDPNVEFFQLDGQDMSKIADGSVDGVNCLFGIMFMPEFMKCVKEMKRVLKPGGKATVATWQKAGVIELIDSFARFLGSVGPDEISNLQNSFAVGKEADQLAGYFKEAGFLEVRVVEDRQDLKLEDLTPLFASAMTNPMMLKCVRSGKPGAKEPTIELWQEFLSSSPVAASFHQGPAYSIDMICNMAIATT